MNAINALGFGSLGLTETAFLNPKNIGIDDLITVKKIAGRFQDLADADNLEKLKKKKRNR